VRARRAAVVGRRCVSWDEKADANNEVLAASGPRDKIKVTSEQAPIQTLDSIKELFWLMDSARPERKRDWNNKHAPLAADAFRQIDLSSVNNQ